MFLTGSRQSIDSIIGYTIIKLEVIIFLSNNNMEGVTQEILNLVKKKMEEQGAYDRDAYKQFIKETIDYFEEKGKLTDDDNLEFMEDQLLDMWEEVEEEFAS